MKIKKLILIVMMLLLFATATKASFTIDLISPSNNETGVCPCCIPLCIRAYSLNGSTMNITFWSNLSMDYWDYFWIGADKNVTFSNVTNGTYSFNVCPFNKYNYTYYWNVSVNDGFTINNSDIFRFITAENQTDCPGGFNISELEELGSQRDYVIGLVGIVGILGIIGWFIKRRKE